MNEEIDEDLDEEISAADKKRYKFARKFLLFSAIVIALAASYTTIALFTSKELDLALSPQNLSRLNNTENETNSSAVSFEIEGEFPDEFGQEGAESYKTEKIPPADPSAQTNPGPLDFLITLENLEPKQSIKIILTIVLEVLVIYLVYRQLHIKLNSLNNASEF